MTKKALSVGQGKGLDELIQKAILSHTKQEDEYSVRDVSDQYDMSMPHARDMLETLVKNGFATRRMVGREVLYKAK